MSLATPSNASPGVTVVLSALVNNTGSTALPSGATVYYYVYGPNVNNWVGNASVAGLGAGTAKSYPINWAIPSSATPGTYTYWAIVYNSSFKPLSDWSSGLAFTVSEPPPGGPKPGLWNGSKIKFNVSSDGKKLTSAGSSIIINGTPCSIAFGPIAGSGGCSGYTTTRYLPGDYPITNNSFAYSSQSDQYSITGTFPSSSTSTGTYAINLYSSYCNGYFIGTGSWNANPVSTASQLNSTLSQEGVSDSDSVEFYDIVSE
jgi:hypothetical protein